MMAPSKHITIHKVLHLSSNFSIVSRTLNLSKLKYFFAARTGHLEIDQKGRTIASHH